jgi:4-hydroxy-2-oxoheptanedioate aldolase
VLLPAGGIAQSPPTGRLNPLIAKLEAGEPALTPADWTFIDMEHGPYLLDRLQATLDGLGKRKKPEGQFETAPIVRIPLEGDEDFRFAVKQVLDMGAMGVVFPHVETRAQAVEAIRSMRYPPQRGSKIPAEPQGRRGWGPGRAAALWGFPVNQYAFERADVWPLNPQGELFALIMIETAEGVKHIDEIVRVPGVGGIFIGASDLGVSLGVGPPVNGVNAPETESAVQSVLMACKRAKVACAYPVLGGQAELERRRSEGFRVFLVAGQPPARH